MRLTFVFLFCVSFAFSQSNDSQIAYQFYQTGEYEKAIEIYKELSKGANFTHYYHPYFQCLVLSEKFSEAKKLTNRMINRNSNHLPYQVDLFMIYREMSEGRTAEKTLKRIKDKLEKHPNHVVNVSNALIRYAFYQEA